MNHLQFFAWILLAFSIIIVPTTSLADDEPKDTGDDTPLRYEESITVIGKTVRSGVIPSSIRKAETPEIIRTHNLTDLADLLCVDLIEANMIRKSSLGNEVMLRGFGQADLRTTVDGGLLEGGCGSRKDPALSLIGMMNIADVTVQQGPFDVTVPGALGGTIKVNSKKPEPGLNGELLARYADTAALSGGVNLHGGSERLRFLAGYHYAQSDQYEDGDGLPLYTFLEHTGRPYTIDSCDRDAFEKHDAWGTIEFNPALEQTLRIDYSYGLGNEILTPRVGMDIDEETTNLSRLTYEVANSFAFSDRLLLSLYRNEVDHCPSDAFRRLESSPSFYRHNEVESVITGWKIESVTSPGNRTFTAGIDGYRHDWDGDMYRDDTGAKLADLIPDVKTLDFAGYLQMDAFSGRWEYGGGLRFDRIETEAGAALTQSSAVTDTNRVTDDLISGFLYARLQVTESMEVFFGAGHSVRSPTAVERYLQSPSPYFHGNPDLDPTKNTEVDAGIQYTLDRFRFNAKMMYSDLNSFIYQKGKLTEASHQTWDNIEAHIYGGDISTALNITQFLEINAGASWYQGKKDSQPDEYNKDKDLATMAPLKTSLGLLLSRSVSFANRSVNLLASAQWVHSGNARDVDEDAGELPLDAWDTINLRLGTRLENVEFHLGVDNLLDAQYAVANSYEWDVVAGSGANPSIINEPGRSFFVSAGITF